MMQQSRLAAAFATRSSFRALLLVNKQAPLRGLAAIPTGRPADPEVCSRERDREVQLAGSRTSKLIEPSAAPKLPLASSARLENVPVRNSAEPNIQQKRKDSTSTLEDVSCAGLDGTPWPKEQSKSSGNESEEDDREYFKHHKASPLSEIKVVDTRKPITRATDGTADAAEDEYGGGGAVNGWLPEQLDTAEEALERARRIWMENASRGDPDSPHGRVLRLLRGEWF